jgi:hypothetical protein
VKVGLKEKYKFGGYRCIALKVFDTTGGDFVENSDLSMLVIETKHNKVVTEIGKEMPLTASPEGLFKKVEIGVNNYSPTIFLSQKFMVYFVKDSKDYSQHKLGLEDIMPVSDMRSEDDIFQDRLDKDLVAFGEFNASDLMSASICPDDFVLTDRFLLDNQSGTAPKDIKRLETSASSKVTEESTDV